MIPSTLPYISIVRTIEYCTVFTYFLFDNEILLIQNILNQSFLYFIKIWWSNIRLCESDLEPNYSHFLFSCFQTVVCTASDYCKKEIVKKYSRFGLRSLECLVFNAFKLNWLQNIWFPLLFRSNDFVIFRFKLIPKFGFSKFDLDRSLWVHCMYQKCTSP